MIFPRPRQRTAELCSTEMTELSRDRLHCGAYLLSVETAIPGETRRAQSRQPFNLNGLSSVETGRPLRAMISVETEAK